MLQEGNTRQRKDALRLVQRGSRIAHGRLLRRRLAACAVEKDPEIRRAVANAVGGRLDLGAEPQNPAAIDLELRLAKDKNDEVRSEAVYYGLLRVIDKREDVVRRALELRPHMLARRCLSIHRGGLEEQPQRAADPRRAPPRRATPRRPRAATLPRHHRARPARATRANRLRRRVTPRRSRTCTSTWGGSIRTSR